MKNIHVLTTDKPSRLYSYKNNLFLTTESHLHSPSMEYQNIYITNDEEIKEGDWYLYCNRINKRIRKNPKAEYPYPNYQKIILTTDQDLIKDGVQTIDDEFLEWFVKNPSCEEVKVESKITKDGVWTDLKGYVELPTTHSIIHKIIIPKEEPKQETLEEAAGRCAIKENRSSLYELGMKYFIEGAKWDQERSYSEEDMIQFVSFVGKNYIKAKGFYYMKGDFEKSMKVSIHQILEQFKKK